MDPKEYLQKSLGIPLDPEKQKDPEADGDHVPAEGRAEFLNDVGGQDGGQRTEVGHPYDGEGDLQQGQRAEYLKRAERKPTKKR
ncbi:hypothetical protein [Myxococcus qinghaiensis]|uniref:hypothetical protein n=1 Tax=Myxococcus qinghaiensis TaxID=2906758 RepID=UPI0020A7B345|nr:hypothetical protein [Myxococcus qinghaiensis]MCP3167026.1 hypothetical protein [Myxococcus qinghaiensis]